MGSMRDLQVELWQQKAGLEIPDPATGGAWRKLQEAAFAAIKIAELEMSGIRDGDGYWSGGDVIGGLLSDLEQIVARLMRLNGMRPSGDLPSSPPSLSENDGMPF